MKNLHKSVDLTSAEVYPTWRCNLNCPTCVQRLIPGRYQGVLTKEEFASFLDSLKQQGIHLRTLEFNGGEVTLWPHFRWAIEQTRASGVVDRIVVISNGVRCRVKDFDGVDLVRVTDYGAINAKDILRLRSVLGRKRFRCSRVIHRDVVLDREPVSKSIGWPADCSSPAINLGPDGRVYPCGCAVIEGWGGYDLNSDWLNALRSLNPFRQERCLSCPSNCRLPGVQYGDADPIGLVFEFSIWGTPYQFLWHISSLNVFRWRYLFSRYYRK